jgi:hypothetical protein
MNPVEMKRGHFYFAINCPTPKCEERLALVEVPPRAEMSEFRKRLQDMTVRCPSCTQEMQVHERASILP